MKKIKTKEKVSVALSEEIREYLKNNIINQSKYIEYLIYEDLIKHNAIEKKEYYDYEKDM
jgi:DNA repair protein RadC